MGIAPCRVTSGGKTIISAREFSSEIFALRHSESQLEETALKAWLGDFTIELFVCLFLRSERGETPIKQHVVHDLESPGQNERYSHPRRIGE